MARIRLAARPACTSPSPLTVSVSGEARSAIRNAPSPFCATVTGMSGETTTCSVPASSSQPDVETMAADPATLCTQASELALSRMLPCSARSVSIWMVRSCVAVSTSCWPATRRVSAKAGMPSSAADSRAADR